MLLLLLPALLLSHVRGQHRRMGLLSRPLRAPSQHAERYGRGGRVRRLAIPRLRPHSHVFRIQPQQLADVYKRMIPRGRIHIRHFLPIRINRVPRDGGARVMGRLDRVPRHQQSAVLRS